MDAVIHISWPSGYDSVRGIVKHFGPVWEKSGLEMVEVNAGSKNFYQELSTIINQRQVRFALSVAGVGARVPSNKGPLWEALRIPVFSLLMDHPAYMVSAHNEHPKNTILGYLFKDHALYQAEEVRTRNIVTHIDYGIPELPMRPVQELTKSPRLIFAKTGNDPARLAANWRAAPKVETILHDVLDELGLKRNGVAQLGAFHPLIKTIAAAHRVELQPYDDLSRYLVAQIDDYIRRVKSTAIAQALLPFAVDVFGRGWEHIDTSKAKARFHGPVGYDQLEAAFPRAAASITMNPNVDFSAHDRFFTALGAGIMPISDRNAYTAQNFPELLPYTFDFCPGSIAAALEHFSANPSLALETARASRDWRRPAHGIETTAAEILAAVQTMRYLYYTDKTDQDFFIP
jgi:hypothetical protein